MSKKGLVRYNPTQQDIELACQEIQATWSAHELDKRIVTKNPEVTIPHIKLTDIPYRQLLPDT